MKLAIVINKHQDWEHEDPFDGTLYAPIASHRSSVERNKRLSVALAELLEDRGQEVEKRKGVADLIVDGDRCMIRLSSSDFERAQWSSLYNSKDYQYAYLVHLSPTTEIIWCVPVEVLAEHTDAKVGRTKNPHLVINPFEPPTWMDSYEL